MSTETGCTCNMPPKFHADDCPLSSQRRFMTDVKHTAEWPARLKLRDTKVIADEGQRIYTTATGYGYAKCEYVRADIADDLLQMLKVAQLWLDVDGRFDMQGINAALSKASGETP